MKLSKKLNNLEPIITEQQGYENAYGQASPKKPKLVPAIVLASDELVMTNIRKVEDLLQQAAAENMRLVQAIASVSDGVLITDPSQPDHPIIYSNPAFSKMTGYQPEEIIGRNCRFLQGKDTDPQAIAQIRSAIAERREVTVTLLNYRKDGQPFWNELKISPVFSSNGDLLYFIGIQTDISDRKQAEAERIQLLEREQAARAEAEAARNQTINILESITDAFFTLDPEWHFTYVNSQAEQLLFRNKQDLINKSFWNEFPELVGSTFEREYHRAVSHQVTVQFEEFYLPLETWFEVRAYPYQDGLSVFFRDVTGKKQAEAALLERSRLSTLEAHIGAALGQGGTLSESLNRCTEEMVQHLDAVFAGVWTFNEGSNNLELQAYNGQPENGNWVAGNDQFEQQPLPLEGSLIGFVAQTRHPYMTQDSNKRSQGGFESRLYSGQLAESCLVRGDSYFTGYPLSVEDKLVGVIAVVSSQPFSEVAYELLGWVANALAVSIDRLWAREALSSRREGLLFRLASQIRKSLDLDTILGTAVNEIRSLLQVDLCQYLWYFDHPTQPSLMVTHESKADPNLPNCLAEYPPQKLSLLAHKVFDLDTLRVDDVASDNSIDSETKELLGSLGLTSALLLPLETPHSSQRGAILCTHCSGQRLWSDSEVELLQAVVDQVAIAIDQAEVYAQSRAAALAAQTQAKQLEQTLQELKQTESRLIQTEKMSSLGQMVAGIAHEINNPVNFISGNISHTREYIRDLLQLIKLYQQHYPNPHAEIEEQTEEVDLEFLIDDLPKLLTSMQVGADRIRQIVLSLRNFSRLDEADMKPVDIHEGIESTLMILQNRFKPTINNKSGIAIVKEYGELPLVDCYAGQLNQVFMNIIGNAVDALESNLVENFNPIIRIQTQMSADGTGVVIRIADNGVGITPDVLKRLFDPFFTTKPVGKGTGLGLSISYQIVEKHHGVLRCESDPGKGAEFWIEIPLHQN